MNYETDIKLEQKFAKMIKFLLGATFFTQNFEEDVKNATDFLILSADPVKVGVRLRRFSYYKNFSNEFTIRWSRPSGVKTEIYKIREGLVSHIFYGFINEEGTNLIQWFIGDLEVFRSKEPKPETITTNKNGDSSFAVYSLSSLPMDFIVSSFGLTKNKMCDNVVN